MDLPDMTDEEREELTKATSALSAGKSATGKPTKRPASSTLDAEWIGKTLELGQKKGSSKVSAEKKLKLGKKKGSSKVSAEPTASGSRDVAELSEKEQMDMMKVRSFADIGRRVPESDSDELSGGEGKWSERCDGNTDIECLILKASF